MSKLWLYLTDHLRLTKEAAAPLTPRQHWRRYLSAGIIIIGALILGYFAAAAEKGAW